jgi:predicted nucleotidyltransferase
MENKYSLDYIKRNNLILLSVVSGSHAYGTNTSTSDVDERGVYIAELDDIFSGNSPEQINDDKNDIVYYELSRFLNLISTNNPNILELLSTPEDCVKIKHPLFDEIIKHKNQFITKKCKYTFGSYASAQIKKAKGLNKKQNWEKDKVTRKDLLDFCYVLQGEKSIPIKKWLVENNMDPRFVGVTSIPNAKDMYSIFYDKTAELLHSEKYSVEEREKNKNILREAGKPMGLGYKGLVKVGDGEENKKKENYGISNQLRLSSIPKGEKCLGVFSFNKDGYSEHCKDFSEYQEWLENRNEARYVETQEHGQKIDGKNMMHCMRLIRMATEIGEGKGIIVRRPDAQELLAIRRGEVDLDSLIDIADKAIENMDEVFENSNLHNKVDKDLVNKLLVKIRKEFYKTKKNKFNFWPFN